MLWSRSHSLAQVKKADGETRCLPPSPLVATAAAAIGAGFAALAQYVSFVPPGGQASFAAVAIGCLLLGLAVGCCCGLGWGLLIGSAAPKATALVGRAFARFAAQAAVSAAGGGALPHPGYALRPQRRA